ncbi:hypothetical protein NNJEOMEG_02323 [Fundidesulfovibrio magnetotacticus]|uniref:Uncharacterized protein n=1 Tax=Fundidesulfovibrio magnetotacticus TaxID=2730080 RepID=A0A6V8LVZ1_9BACT|nr:hypothetical protein [Fundidesulfovibrio magnetotacticus]GFK94478.1 hypothetical protein NNJEOMEG_02323 [Fundidesulfovibrio magnetotacticus]
MSLPAKSSKQWQDVVTGKKAYELKFLAAKILLGRLTRSLSENPSPDNVKAGIDQLYDVYAKNSHIPSVQDDLKTIFG